LAGPQAGIFEDCFRNTGFFILEAAAGGLPEEILNLLLWQAFTGFPVIVNFPGYIKKFIPGNGENCSKLPYQLKSAQPLLCSLMRIDAFKMSVYKKKLPVKRRNSLLTRLAAYYLVFQTEVPAK
jgi:hypothetical protein